MTLEIFQLDEMTVKVIGMTPFVYRLPTGIQWQQRALSCIISF